jgi:hypothetical protein
MNSNTSKAIISPFPLLAGISYYESASIIKLTKLYPIIIHKAATALNTWSLPGIFFQRLYILKNK